MTFSTWMLAAGLLLVFFSVSNGLLSRLPLSPAILYFACGIAIGPIGLGWLASTPADDGVTLEHLCELAVLVSLFVTGLGVGSTLRTHHWRIPLRLASVGMVVTVALIAGFAYVALGLSLGMAVLLGAVLAPTDPVLAGDVQVNDPSDRDRLRFGLTGEAGLNDGAAFPFVMLGLGLLGLHDLGAGGWRWVALDLVWAVAGGIGIGAAVGTLAGRWLVRRPAGELESGAGAFLGLGLLAVAYGVAVAASTYGFLAVFAAAVAVQWSVTSSSPAAAPPAGAAPPTHRNLLVLHRSYDDLESFGEFAIVIILGVLWASVPFLPESLLLGALLFVVFRPLSVAVALAGVRLGRQQRALASWFGIRGVGTLYYVLYALNHGASGAQGERLLGLALGVVTLSIIVHGISVTPLMARYRPPPPPTHSDRA